jgi:O-antigen biosynthesis protein
MTMPSPQPAMLAADPRADTLDRILAAGFFEPAAAAGDRRQALADYLSGDPLRALAPSPDFDPQAYLDYNPDALTSGLHPLRHYAEVGAARGAGPGVARPSAVLKHFQLVLGPRIHVLKTHRIGLENGRIVSIGPEPEIDIELVAPLRPGWARIELSFEGEERPVLALYYTDEEGRASEHALRITDVSRMSALVRILAPLARMTLRCAPHAVLAIAGLDLRPVGSVGLTRVIARRAYDIVRRDPRGAWRIATNFARLATRGGGLTIAERKPVSPAADSASDPYERWIDLFDDQPERDRANILRRIAALPRRPLISVLMPVYNPPADLLDAAIRSVVDQIYPHWELCIADDASLKPEVAATLERWAADPRIKIVKRETNGHIVEATRSAFTLAGGEYVALLDHDDVLRPHALAEVAFALSANPGATVIYSDEDKIDRDGRRRDPYFKPDWSPDLFRAQNYLNHLTVLRAEEVRAVGGWRPGLEGSQDYDILLRITERAPPGSIVHIPKVLYHWRMAPGSTATDVGEKSYATDAALRALDEHVARIGLKGRVEKAPGTPYYRVVLDRPDPAPLVSLIIPTRDMADLVRTCVGSILGKTLYAPIEILIVDNNSSEPETFALFEELTRDPRVRVIRYPHPFNYSAINNFAVREAKGTLIGLVNNDIEVIAPEWLDEMVAHAMRPVIGCVGAKLYYPDDRIQHAGVILGIGGVAGHAHKHFRREEPGYFGRLRIAQNISAVTAACLVVRRSVYEEVGGLDEVNLTVAFNDVDFCLRVRQRGYLNLWTPFAELYHHESVSRGSDTAPERLVRAKAEIAHMLLTWQDELRRDPYYSPHLTMVHEDFSLRTAR